MVNNDEKFSAYVSIAGFEFDPEQITRVLNIGPSASVRKGDVRIRDPEGVATPKLYEMSIWTYVSELPGSASFEEHVESILSKIRPVKAEFIELCRSSTAELGIEGTIYEPHVGVYLNANQVRECAELGLRIDISYYVFSQDYLASNDNVEDLESALQALESVNIRDSEDHNEANAIAKALSVLQKQSNDICEELADKLSWEAYDFKEREEMLGAIKTKLGVINAAVNGSRYLSDKKYKSKLLES